MCVRRFCSKQTFGILLLQTYLMYTKYTIYLISLNIIIYRLPCTISRSWAYAISNFSYLTTVFGKSSSYIHYICSFDTSTYRVSYVIMYNLFIIEGKKKIDKKNRVIRDISLGILYNIIKIIIHFYSTNKRDAEQIYVILYYIRFVFID